MEVMERKECEAVPKAEIVAARERRRVRRASQEVQKLPESGTKEKNLSKKNKC